MSSEARVTRREASKKSFSMQNILDNYHAPLSNGMSSVPSCPSIDLDNSHISPHMIHPMSSCTDFTSGTASLPSPIDGTCLKAITLGRGTQNYTCATNTASSVPVAIGAVATLFDATPLLAFLPQEEGKELLNILPGFLVSFPYAALENSSLPIKGHHYFNAAGVPTFDLTSTGVGLLLGGKIGDVLPPKRSIAGPDDVGNGAVDWLTLTAKPGSSNLQEVYRTWTAGGKPPANCADQPPVITMQYAAQYWFYG